MKIGFAGGILFGAVIGGAYGLLKTPRTGEENRVAMKSYLDDTTVLVQDVTEKVKDLKGAISELSTESKLLAGDFAKDMNDTMTEFSYEVEPRMRRIQDQVNKLSKDAQEMQNNIQPPTGDQKQKAE